MTASTATLTDIRPVAHDGVFLLLARCDRCNRDVMHGGGYELNELPGYLGHRAAHCKCPGGYEISDPDGVLSRRQAEIRAEGLTRSARRGVTAPQAPTQRRTPGARFDAVEAALVQILAEVRALGARMDAEAADTGD